MQPETASKLKGFSGTIVAKASELVNYQDGAVVTRLLFGIVPPAMSGDGLIPCARASEADRSGCHLARSPTSHTTG